MRRFIWLLVCLLLCSTIVLAQVPPAADTYVASGAPTTNYGTSGILALQPNVYSYIRFDLSGIPANATVQKAVLRLFVSGAPGSGSFDVYQINTVWTETTLTWNNKPALGASATGGHPVPLDYTYLQKFVLVDITSLVQQWVNGTTANNGVALALTTQTGSFSFDTKEATNTSHQPELDIAIPGAQGAQGPQGATGAAGTNGQGFNFRNAFSNSANYNAYDVVTYNGSTYEATVAIAAGQGTPVQNPNWALMAQQGAQGQAGATGPQGASGPQGPTGATGAQGPQGTQGPIGLTGPQGPQGAAGAAGGNGQGFTFQNAFNNSTNYNAYDVVTYGGSTYEATVAIAAGGGTPDLNSNWALMAQQGAQGQAGATGPQGASGPQGPTGANGAQGPQGTQGPIGLTGPQGPQGTAGAAGANGQGFTFQNAFNNSTNYNAYDVVTYGGSTYEAMVAIAAGGGTPDLNSNWALMAQQGAQGQAGATGPQGASGPQGPAGATGSQGTSGPQGPAGANGAQGPQGPIGLTGPQGPSGGSTNWRGTWNNTATYNAIDAVAYNGSSYVALSTNVNAEPDISPSLWQLLAAEGQGFTFRNAFSNSTNYNAYDVVTYGGSTYEATVAIAAGGGTPDLNSNWALMAQQGAQGQAGATGPQGASGPQGPTGANGAQGPQGTQGPIGLTGPQGPQGTAGAAGANGQGFTFQNAFNNSTNYNAYDVVTYGGSTYEATVAIAAGGGTPDLNSNWALMAQQGAQGQAGATGPQGASGPQGPAGATGSQGTSGPQGPAGANGAQGPQGPIGLTGPQGPSGGSTNWRGTWNNTATYNAIDAVAYNGSSYVALSTNVNAEPDISPSLWQLLAAEGQGFTFRNAFSNSTNYNAYDVVTYGGSTYEATVAIAAGGGTPDLNSNWALMAQQGAQGQAGATGPQGASGPQGPTGANGAQGPQGTQGPIGLTGPQGPQGTAGAAGANGQGFTFQNAFNNSTNYNAYDVVTYGGSTYEATVAIAAGGGTPDLNSNWALMAQQGAQGQAGATGPQGASGPQGPAGATGSQGTSGPQGPAGANGAQGPQGPIGLTGPQGPSGGSTNWRGTWNNTATYNAIDAVAYNGSSYVALSTNVNAEPDISPSLWQLLAAEGQGFTFRNAFSNSTNYNAYDVVTYGGSTYEATVAIAAGGGTPDLNSNWALMAQQGAQGQAGATGSQGTSGPQGPAGANGAQGPQGTQGPIGLTGPQGPQGTAGAAGANGQGFTFQNAFNNSTNYNAYDVVTYGGSTYEAMVAIAAGGGTPDLNSNWALMAQQGAQGQAGATGPQGASGPQGPAGATGSQGTSGPQGPAGANGAQGPQGPIGLTGPQGPQGVPGNLVPNSPYYIQNGTTLQTGASFNIDGTGTVGGMLQGGAVNATNTTTNQAFSIGGTAFLGIGSPSDQNVFIGSGAGNNNVAGSGISNLFSGSGAGQSNTTGSNNVYSGFHSGYTNTTGAGNVFTGYNSGFYNTGNSNTFFGNLAGGNNTTGSSNIYLANQGCTYPCTESNTIRIGTQGTGLGQQNATYIAGINGTTTNAGVPVFIDSTGLLGTGGGTMSGVTSFNGRTGAILPQAGDYTAAQITGALQSTNNLSDVTNAATARANLSVPRTGDVSSSGVVTAVNGTTLAALPSGFLYNTAGSGIPTAVPPTGNKCYVYGGTGGTGCDNQAGPMTRTWLFSYQGVCQAGVASAPINFPTVNAPSYVPCTGSNMTPEWQIPGGSTTVTFWVKLRVPTGHTGPYTLTATFRSATATGSARLQPSVACVGAGQVPDNPPFSPSGISPITLAPAGVLQNVSAAGTFTPTCADGADLYVMFTFPANSVTSPINFSYIGLAVQGSL